MNDYYPVVYSYDDFPIAVFDDIEDLPQFFNVSLYKILDSIRNNRCVLLNGKKVKIYLFKKEKQNQLILERKR